MYYVLSYANENTSLPNRAKYRSFQSIFSSLIMLQQARIAAKFRVLAHQFALTRPPELVAWEQLFSNAYLSDLQACCRDNDIAEAQEVLLANKYRYASLLNMMYLPLRSRRS